MKTIPCPCCQKEICQAACTCLHCGYQSEKEGFRQFLQALQTVTSILLGFSATGLINLNVIQTPRSLEYWAGYIFMACWFLAAISFLTVVVGCEALLRKKDLEGIHPDKTVEDFFKSKCSHLIQFFLLASLCMGLGIIALGFYYSFWHGLLALVGILLGGRYIFSLFLRSPKKKIPPMD